MGKQRSYKGKKQYAMYKAEDRFAKNKKRKILKHMKSNPNDLYNVLDFDFAYSRSKANTKGLHDRATQIMDKMLKGLINKANYEPGNTMAKAIRLAGDSRTK